MTSALIAAHRAESVGQIEQKLIEAMTFKDPFKTTTCQQALFLLAKDYSIQDRRLGHFYEIEYTEGKSFEDGFYTLTAKKTLQQPLQDSLNKLANFVMRNIPSTSIKQLRAVSAALRPRQTPEQSAYHNTASNLITPLDGTSELPSCILQ